MSKLLLLLFDGGRVWGPGFASANTRRDWGRSGGLGRGSGGLGRIWRMHECRSTAAAACMTATALAVKVGAAHPVFPAGPRPVASGTPHRRDPPRSAQIRQIRVQSSRSPSYPAACSSTEGPGPGCRSSHESHTQARQKRSGAPPGDAALLQPEEPLRLATARLSAAPCAAASGRGSRRDTRRPPPRPRCASCRPPPAGRRRPCSSGACGCRTRPRPG